MEKSIFPKVALLANLLGASLACGEPTTPMTILEPSAGEALIAGTLQNIEWKPASGVSKVDIWLAVPDGKVIAIAKGSANTGTFSWKVPILPVSSSALSVLHVASKGSMPDGARDLLASNIAPAADDDGTPIGVGSLAGFRWNETTQQEEYYWIDTTDGSTEVKGIVGDLAVWQGEVIVDYGRHIFYVLGTGGTLDDAMHGRGVEKIYTMDIHSGDLLDSRPLDMGPATVSDRVIEGQILGFRWNATDIVEEMVRIDISTGSATVVGTVGDLMWWGGESIIDEEAGVVYVIGMPGLDSPEKIYTLDLATGDLLNEVLLETSPSYNRPVSVKLLETGALLGFRWRLDPLVEEMVRIDPTTGVVTAYGTVGDLYWWSGIAPLNVANRECYAFGLNGAEPGTGETKMYIMDTVTGALLQDFPVIQDPGIAILVY